jgi:hypothetical protein
MHRGTLLGLISLFSTASYAAPSPAPSHTCSAAEIRAARRDAEKRVKAHDPAGARDLLAALEKRCSIDTGDRDAPNLEALWYYSDRSWDSKLAGDPVECMRLLAQVSDPHDGLLEAAAAAGVAKAIEHNEQACEAAHEEARKEFEARPCPFAAGAGTTAVAAGDACLAIESGADYDTFKQALDSGKEGDAARLCPRLLRITRAGRQRLRTRDGILADTSSCCGANQLAVATSGGKLRVRVTSKVPSRDCFGGTATTAIDAIYELRGAEAHLTDDDSLLLH